MIERSIDTHVRPTFIPESRFECEFSANARAREAFGLDDMEQRIPRAVKFFEDQIDPTLRLLLAAV